MPLTPKGETILANFKKEYGAKEGESNFYASANKGTITGVHDEELSGQPGLQTSHVSAPAPEPLPLAGGPHMPPTVPVYGYDEMTVIKGTAEKAEEPQQRPILGLGAGRTVPVYPAVREIVAGEPPGQAVRISDKSLSDLNRLHRRS